jgi:F0F1-type ATP synthase membrane subunit b/b'
LSPALANFLFEAANFLVLAGALAWLLFKPMRNALQAEQERRAEEESKIAKARDEADALMTEARDAHNKLETELEEQRTAMLAEARKEIADLKEKARKEQFAETQANEKKQEAARRAQARQLATTLGRISAASVRDLLDTVSGPSLDLALVRAACGELSALPSGAKTSCIVESARPLEDAARSLLREAIGHDFEERIVAELGAGVRVTTTQGQIDGSATSLAQQAAQQIEARAMGSTGRGEGAAGE